MADEVYKILQGRLRLKQAQLDNCGDQYDCDGCTHHSTKQHLDDSARRKRTSNSNSGEVSYHSFQILMVRTKVRLG